MNDSVKKLLSETDRVLLDIKYTTDELYKKYVGCSIEVPLKFLSAANELAVPVTLRQVIIPSLNDTAENIRALKKISETYQCVDTVELLPFRKICQVKYDKMEIPFPFAHFSDPDAATMLTLNKILSE